MNNIMQTCQDTRNETLGMPIEDRLDYGMATSCTMKAIARHHLYMKTGFGSDRTFPDCMMTFVFGWGKAGIQHRFRKSDSMTNEEKKAIQDKTAPIIPDYQATSAERFKRITNEMFLSM